MRLQEKDVLTLENEWISVALLPKLGGKISSLCYRPLGFELLCPPLRPFQTAQCGNWFEHFDLCGLDDMFPCIDGEEVDVGGKSVTYPDHGEIWSADMMATRQDDCVILEYASRLLPYHYRKTISLEGRMLRMDYRITHTGGDPFPCLWAFHGLVRREPGMKLLYPRGTKRFENVMDSPELGENGKEYDPCRDFEYDFSTVPEHRTMLKYYAADPVQEGRCGYRYPQGVDCTLWYDPEKLPYLGFWLCSGELGGADHCAFEPANGYFDAVSIAKQRGCCPELKEGQVLEFTLCLELSGQ